MVLSLIGPLDDPHVHRVLLVAAYAGTRLKVVPVTIGKENETESYRRNCHPLGRVPVLKSDEGYLFETNAIIRYLARTERLYGLDGSERHPSPQHLVPYILYGKSVQEAAEVDAWLDFVVTELDPHILPLIAMEKEEKTLKRNPRGEDAGAKALPLQPRVDALHEGLNGLEQRLVFKKQLRKLQATGGGGGNNPVSARTGNMEEVDEGLSEEEYWLGVTPRGSSVLRGYHTYNIKTQLEDPNQINSAREIASNNEGAAHEGGGVPYLSAHFVLSSPRPSTQASRFSMHTPRRSAPAASDMLFLVGDSLTAADLVVSLAINQALLLKQLCTTLKQRYPQVVRYHCSILRLPVAAQLRKALGINIL
ncbi:putative elongation factor 1-gamma (EF-1-gamma) [Trypanosoma cruzi]|uniref:Elongation factor 1-gamma (EF-1-gamma), putative n=2 Tax=Trypanosoma cruzi TaxID=5693 RepID=Q4DUM3_TRYCC|nr:elongation factor 1-gamma (EF-1-gamma), putative [Trypanosoma cruzi]AAL82703.1 Tcc1a22.3 [Trypanosoma cruzi]EAN96235.1 elongation factor 1-gamma (EF-1-gamma), putative [Trypanosoma cruzi]RNC37539.1 putative elongation factor 1-gamma (EF-1-gamma) [Trypanosoma cruzi]|eukprot:XP_818086.1 elongation factor 1-gamma (EF-1-gamma) [Trypanosoma cruzi strain CL Brener]